MRLPRRSFLQQLASGLAIAPWVTTGLRAQSPNSVVHHASFGCGGMGMLDLNLLTKSRALEVVAGCEVDEARTVDFRKKWPRARVYRDYREMLDKEKDLQTVNISTPDHMHGVMGVAAMNRGLHVYGEKPLAHNLYECRRLTEIAREKKIVTQMGIQFHSSPEYYTAVKLIQEGAIGKVVDVHTWSNKAWGDEQPMPPAGDPIPEGFDWDLWLGVCAPRGFIGNRWYHPGYWRKRVDFGTGTFGDMGCHIFDGPFKALALSAPLSVRSEGRPPNEHSWATDAIVHFVFPGTEFTAEKTIKVTWYDGIQRPPRTIRLPTLATDLDVGENKLPDQGTIFFGTDGVMILPHVGMPRIIDPQRKSRPISLVKGDDHHVQFVNAARGEGRTTASFDYGGPLTEAVLLGTVASRFPQQELQWDAAKLAFTNVPEANQFVRRTYRQGWQVEGLG